MAIAVDPHKASWTAAAVDASLQPLATIGVPVGDSGYQQLRRFARRWPQAQWAIEGATGLGAPLTIRLREDRIKVIDVPAKLATRVRLLSTGHGRKNDDADAISVKDAVALAVSENGLAVISTVRTDGTVQASLVNVGLLPHPASGEPILGFTTYGKIKLANLRAQPQLAITFRNGWHWATVEGNAEIAGADDKQRWLTDDDQLRLLLRKVFLSAGGTHDNWPEYDRVMAKDRRAVVLVEPTRVYSNG